MTEIEFPDGRIVRFPDGTPEAVIRKAVTDFLWPPAPPPDVEPEDKASPVTNPHARWACRCAFPDGRIETSYWATQDAADQMETETEQAFPGTVCTVEPCDDAPEEDAIAAVPPSLANSPEITAAPRPAVLSLAARFRLAPFTDDAGEREPGTAPALHPRERAERIQAELISSRIDRPDSTDPFRDNWRPYGRR